MGVGETIKENLGAAVMEPEVTMGVGGQVHVGGPSPGPRLGHWGALPFPRILPRTHSGHSSGLILDHLPYSHHCWLVGELGPLFIVPGLLFAQSPQGSVLHVL